MILFFLVFYLIQVVENILIAGILNKSLLISANKPVYFNSSKLSTNYYFLFKNESVTNYFYMYCMCILCKILKFYRLIWLLNGLVIELLLIL